ncbi:MAG: U32 family peptidase [Desulfovibrio sp.]|nr:U32 family peptidase [Desulfovibrio sp.]
MASDGPRLKKPEILAPAGDKKCFLAALAAGADAVYLGLKQFSARMEADNFELGELAELTALAHDSGRKVMVAMNTLIKEDELGRAFSLCEKLTDEVRADGLIIQDPGMLNIASQAGFAGSLTLSTLANVGAPSALATAAKLGATRVVIPRELSVDEMRTMGEKCPDTLSLECFVHGALCYCVSGRCYWSSYLGGKSGLRGRCVQPCRRLYSKLNRSGKKSPGERLFACQDLELGVLVKTLLSIPRLDSWKIEGRRKGPHYVFHTTTAYKLLRDNPDDSQARKMAEGILDFALGRPGVRARFLPQRQYQPMAPDKQTSSGLLAGKTRAAPDGGCILKPRFDLLPEDYLRVGVEDERWHATISVSRATPKGGSLRLNLPRHKTPPAGVPVYLIDRREPELKKILGEWEARLKAVNVPPPSPEKRDLRMPRPAKRIPLSDMIVSSSPKKIVKSGATPCLWLSRRTVDSVKNAKMFCYWLSPAVWPENEEETATLVVRALRAGCQKFVLNSPWQRSLFPDKLPERLRLVAGPFCNLSNALAIEETRSLGFSAAFASPELPGEDLANLAKASPLPLGFVISGYWPTGISRFGLTGANVNEPFFSPRGEAFWARDYGGDIWIYPAWPLDLSAKRRELEAGGFSFFAAMDETPPPLPDIKRPGLFNYEGKLL